MSDFYRTFMKLYLSFFGSGSIRRSGTKWKRKGKNFKIIGKSIDPAVQPTSFSDFKHLVKKDAKLGVNLYFAYSGPGLCKPIYPHPESGNGHGLPYKDMSLRRNNKYWEEVDNRIIYANSNGISVVIANTFVDRGVCNKWTLEQLKSDWKKTVERYRGFSVMFIPLSEYDEHGSIGINTGIELVNATKTNDPVALHPIRTSIAHIGITDFVCMQGYSRSRIQQALGTGKPAIVAEDQNANDQTVINRFNEAEALGATYIITNRNFGFSPTLENFIKSKR